MSKRRQKADGEPTTPFVETDFGFIRHTDSFEDFEDEFGVFDDYDDENDDMSVHSYPREMCGVSIGPFEAHPISDDKNLFYPDEEFILIYAQVVTIEGRRHQLDDLTVKIPGEIMALLTEPYRPGRADQEKLRRIKYTLVTVSAVCKLQIDEIPRALISRKFYEFVQGADKHGEDGYVATPQTLLRLANAASERNRRGLQRQAYGKG